MGMALTNETFCDLYEGLKHNFLFNNDLNSIHILLNLYDIEDNIRNIFPKYISLKYLKSSITRILRERRGKQLISQNLGNLIHEDINRLELLLYLEGYKNGFADYKEVNKIEDIAVKYFSIDQLYYQKYLFHFESEDEHIHKLKEKVSLKLELEEEKSLHLEAIINDYCENVIKKKVSGLNKFVDKQLTLDYSRDLSSITEDETLLTKDELNNVYNEVVKIITRNVLRLYKDAYWYGINDRVLKRYR